MIRITRFQTQNSCSLNDQAEPNSYGLQVQNFKCLESRDPESKTLRFKEPDFKKKSGLLESFNVLTKAVSSYFMHLANPLFYSL